VREHRVQIFLSSRVGSSVGKPRQLRDLKVFEQTLLNEILFPALAGRKRPGALRTFEQFWELTGNEVRPLSDINSPAGVATIAETEPDLILSIRYGVILRPPVIALARLGVLNLHSGLLPAYRGVMATFWALLHGEQEIGTTLHFIRDAGIDTGDIVGRTRLPVDRARSYLWHVLQLYPRGCELMLQTVQALAAGRKVSTEPQGSGGAYFSFPDAADVHAFEQAGFRLYDPDEWVEFARGYLEPEEALV
jgi:methionyl-tRNA formyltransferase